MPAAAARRAPEIRATARRCTRLVHRIPATSPAHPVTRIATAALSRDHALYASRTASARPPCRNPTRRPGTSGEPFGVVHDAVPLTQLEARYLVSPGEAQRFLSRATGQLTPDLFDLARPIAFVRTTYFDSDEQELFRSQRRRRVRLREYAGAPAAGGVATLTGVSAFEVKESGDGLRRKVRAFADRAELMRLLRRGPGRAIDSELAQAAAQVKSGRLRPRLTTFCRRRSFSGEGVRVTLDDRLVFARPVRLGRAGEPAEPAHLVGRGPQLILEVKSCGALPSWLAEAASDFLLVTRFSKFKEGMLAIARADSRPGLQAAPRVSMARWLRAPASSPHESPPSP